MKKRGAFFYILILLSLAALAALVFLLVSGAHPETPSVALAPLPSGDNSGMTPVSAPPEPRAVVVDTESVQTVIATLSRADSYSRVLTIRNFWSGGSASTEVNVWVRGENARITIREDDDSVKNVLLRGGEKWIWYSDGTVWHGRAMENDADAYQMLLTYENVLALDPKDILDAGYAEYEGELCIYVRYREGSLGYENLCYISTETGLLTRAETYDKDGAALIYAMNVSRLDISTPDDTLFDVP